MTTKQHNIFLSFLNVSTPSIFWPSTPCFFTRILFSSHRTLHPPFFALYRTPGELHGFLLVLFACLAPRSLLFGEHFFGFISQCIICRRLRLVLISRGFLQKYILDGRIACVVRLGRGDGLSKWMGSVCPGSTLFSFVA